MQTTTLDLSTIREITEGLDRRVNERFDNLCICPKWRIFKKERLKILFDEAYFCRELVRGPLFKDALRNLYKERRD